MMLRSITARAENWTRAALKVSVANESGNSLLMFMAAYLYVHDQVRPGVISVPGSNLFPTALHTLHARPGVVSEPSASQEVIFSLLRDTHLLPGLAS